MPKIPQEVTKLGSLVYVVLIGDGVDCGMELTADQQRELRGLINSPDVPAVLIVDADGMIRWIDVAPNYAVRIEAADVSATFSRTIG